MSENVGFQGAAGVLMTVFVQCLAVLSVLRWSLTSLMSQQKGFLETGGVGWRCSIPVSWRTETPCVSAASGQNQTRPYSERPRA